MRRRGVRDGKGVRDERGGRDHAESDKEGGRM